MLGKTRGCYTWHESAPGAVKHCTLCSELKEVYRDFEQVKRINRRGKLNGGGGP